MRKQSRRWFHLCLSSLVAGATLVAMTPARTPAVPAQTIAQTRNVGGALASQLQGKPVVVDIYASWCPACRTIAPTLSQLKRQYEGSVHFVVLDVTDRRTTSQAESQARGLGLGRFFEANRSQTGMVTIVDPATGNILVQHRNNPNIADYQTVLDASLQR